MIRNQCPCFQTPQTTWVRRMSWMLKIVLSSVLIMWAVRRALEPRALADFGVLLPFLKNGVWPWWIGLSALEAIVASGVWHPRTINAALLTSGLLVILRLILGGLNLRFSLLSSCNITLLEGDPLLIIFQYIILLMITTALWWIHDL